MIIYKFIKNLILHTRCMNAIRQIYKEEHLIDNLSDLIGSQFTPLDNGYVPRFKIDWIGRLYIVFNLLKLKDNAIIFESNADYGYNIQRFAHQWLMQQLTAVENAMINKGLFDIVTYKLDEVEPNIFLFQIIPITWKEFWKWTKIFTITYASAIILAIILTIIIL